MLACHRVLNEKKSEREAELEERGEEGTSVSFADFPDETSAFIVHHTSILRNKRLLLTYMCALCWGSTFFIDLLFHGEGHAYPDSSWPTVIWTEARVSWCSGPHDPPATAVRLRENADNKTERAPRKGGRSAIVAALGAGNCEPRVLGCTFSSSLII